MRTGKNTTRNKIIINIYQFRLKVDRIKYLVKNKSNYDLSMHSKIIKIRDNADKINETIRQSLPNILYHVKALLDNENLMLIEEIEHKISDRLITQYQINELILAKNNIIRMTHENIFEFNEILRKVNYNIRELCENLIATHLNSTMKRENKQLYDKKKLLLTSLDNLLENKKELVENIKKIITAEKIIQNNDLSKYFKNNLPSDKELSSINIPQKEKDIIKFTVHMIKRVYVIVDKGMEYSKLVDTRIYLNKTLSEINDKINIIEYQLYDIEKKIEDSDEIFAINDYRYFISQQSQLLIIHWKKLSMKIVHIIVNDSPLTEIIPILTQEISFLHELEYQYSRSLID